MAQDGKQVVRREGVSTLKPGSSQGADAGSGDEQEGAGRRTAKGDVQADAAVARQAQAAAAEATRLEQKKEGIEEKLDEAKQRGDAKAVGRLQSDLDKTRNSLKDAEKARDDWPRYIVDAARRGLTPAQMIEEIKTSQAKRASETASSRGNEADEIIAELLDSDDDADLRFAQFLRKRLRAGVAVTRANVDSFHRGEYEEFVLKPLADAARAANVVDGKGKDDKEKTTTRRTTPPRTAGAGGSDLGGAKTGWQEGTATIDLLKRGFKEQDEQRAARH